MKLRHPPKLAAWLLRCSGIAAQNSPLAGDLIEEFQHGRSSAWFWRQTLKAIAIGAVQDCRTLGSYGVAIFTGWAIQASIVLALWTFHEPRKLSDSMSWWMLSFTIIIAAASLKAWAETVPALPGQNGLAKTQIGDVGAGSPQQDRRVPFRLLLDGSRAHPSDAIRTTDPLADVVALGRD